jgi:hypothetical protein
MGGGIAPDEGGVAALVTFIASVEDDMLLSTDMTVMTGQNNDSMTELDRFNRASCRGSGSRIPNLRVRLAQQQQT